MLAEEATEKFESARASIADFINAESSEIVFVRSATEAINIVASGLPQDVAVVSSMGEHHSNILPWRNRNSIHQVRLDAESSIDLDDFDTKFQSASENTSRVLVAVSTVGNAFGTINPVSEIVSRCRNGNADILIDASQSIAHEMVDVRRLDCDYLCFSAHKLGGPTGIGVLYAKRDRLEKLKPMLLGGGVVDDVSPTDYTIANLPQRLEAGTPSFEAVIGFEAICDFLREQNLDEIKAHETTLIQSMIDKLNDIPQITIVGPKIASQRGSILSFFIDGLEAHAASRMLSNRFNVCVRSGFHRAQPAHDSLEIRPTIRASVALYNDQSDVDALSTGLQQIAANLT